MPARKVTSIPGVYSFQGKSYGPFEATGDRPHMEVPEEVAFALNLPLHESEVIETPQAAPSPSLPADARERLIAIKGVGEKLADEILEALKA